MNMLHNNLKSILIILLALCIGLVSCFWLGDKMSDPVTYENNIEYLDEKCSQALSLTAIATVASTAISVLPDDIGTPVADKLMDLTSYFGIALGALLLEKFLLTLIGGVVFKIAIPVACLICIVGIILRSYGLKNLAIRIFVYGLVLALIVPCSVKASQLIENTYGFSIEDTEEYAEALTEASEDASSGNEESIDAEESETTENTSSGIFGKIFKKIGDAASDTIDSVKNLGSNVSESAKRALKRVQILFSNLVEKLAVLIVTSCLIPIIVLIIFLSLSKSILGIDFNQLAAKRKIE